MVAQTGAQTLPSLAGWRLDQRPHPEIVPSGFAALDRLLPAGGVRRGSLVEWIAAGSPAPDAGGAVALACAVACRLSDAPVTREPIPGRREASSPSAIVVVDRGARLYPPAVMPWLGPAGGSSERTGAGPRLFVARVSRDDDELWAIDQALRCPGVAAVVAWPGRVPATAMRRWQLAARTAGAIGLLLRGLAGGAATAGREPTWADARVAVMPLAERSQDGGTAGADPAIRRLRLALVGGPWSDIHDTLPEERSTELLLDLRYGREAVGQDDRLASLAGFRSSSRIPAATATPRVAGRFLRPEGVACRAS